MFNRNIFTDSKPSLTERLIDIALAVALCLSLSMLVLHGLDALFI